MSADIEQKALGCSISAGKSTGLLHRVDHEVGAVGHALFPQVIDALGSSETGGTSSDDENFDLGLSCLPGEGWHFWFLAVRALGFSSRKSAPPCRIQCHSLCK